MYMYTPAQLFRHHAIHIFLCERSPHANKHVLKTTLYRYARDRKDLDACGAQDAKNQVKQALIDAGGAYKYAEPEKEVMSRSGNECVVALTDQWYIKYGEDAWKAQVEQHLKRMNLYTDDIKVGRRLACMCIFNHMYCSIMLVCDVGLMCICLCMHVGRCRDSCVMCAYVCYLRLRESVCYLLPVTSIDHVRACPCTCVVNQCKSA